MKRRTWWSVIASVVFWFGVVCFVLLVWTGDYRWFWTGILAVAVALLWTFVFAVAENMKKEER